MTDKTSSLSAMRYSRKSLGEFYARALQSKQENSRVIQILYAHRNVIYAYVGFVRKLCRAG